MNILLDIDECLTNEHRCTQDCINTPGSYECLCQRGYMELVGEGCVGEY